MGRSERAISSNILNIYNEQKWHKYIKTSDYTLKIKNAFNKLNIHLS